MRERVSEVEERKGERDERYREREEERRGRDKREERKGRGERVSLFPACLTVGWRRSIKCNLKKMSTFHLSPITPPYNVQPMSPTQSPRPKGHLISYIVHYF